MPVDDLRAHEPPSLGRVSLATATVATHGDLRVALVLEGKLAGFVGKAPVMAMLASEIVTALGHSALYDAGLERAARVLDDMAAERDASADPRDDLAAAAIEIRDQKVGRAR